MSIALTPDHLALTSTHPLRVALVSLLTDPAGPLADCAAQDDDARTAYLLARIYRRARYDGVLHGKPAHEAEALFAQRVRVTARSSRGPFEFADRLCKAVRLRWEAMSEADRLWWRGESARLSTGTDGLSLTTPWRRMVQPSRLADIITSAMIAQDWIGQIRATTKEADDE